MKPKLKDSLVKGVVSLASFGVSYVITGGTGFLAQLVGDLAKNIFDKFSSDALKPIIEREVLEPHLINHHIEKAIQKSFEATLNSIEESYINQQDGVSEEEKTGVAQFITDCKDKISGELFSSLNYHLEADDVFLLAEGNEKDILKLFDEKFNLSTDFDYFSDETYVTRRFAVFFKEEFGKRLRKAFTNILKSGTESKQAMDLLYQKTIRVLVSDTAREVSEQREIVENIKNMVSRADQKWEDFFPGIKQILREALEETLNRILEELGALRKDLADNFSYTNNKVDQIGRDLSNLEKIISLTRSGARFEDQIDNISIRRLDNSFRFYTAAHDTNGQSTTYKDEGLNYLRKESGANPLLVIQGDGGIGKTSLAEEIGFTFLEMAGDQRPQIIWWVDAENLSNHSKTNLANSNTDLKDLAIRMGIETSTTDWFSKLKAELGRYSYLLVFDNTCDSSDASRFMQPDAFILNYLPAHERKKNQYILTTSRNLEWKRLTQNCITLSVWTVEDFRNYFRMKGIDVSDDDALVKLHDEFRGLPVAAGVAAAYMTNEEMALPAFLNLINDKERFSILEETAHQYYANQPWARVFLIAYEKLVPEARSLLRQIIFLSPDEVPLSGIFENHRKKLDSRKVSMAFTPKGFDKAYQNLRNISLIRKVSREEEYSMHRLIQESFRYCLPEADRRAGLEEIIQTLETALDQFRGTDYGFYRKIFPHIEELAEFRKELISDKALYDRLCQLLIQTGRYCFQTGAITTATGLFDKAMEMSKDNPKLYHELGVALAYNLVLQDKTGEAEQLCENAIRFFADEYAGPDKLAGLLKSKQNLAKVFQKRGEFERGKDVLQDCIAVTQDKDAPSDVTSLYPGLMHDLAALWWDEGFDQPRSIELFQKSIEVQSSADKPNKELYMNVSRMIKGVAHVLNGEYDLQQQEHEMAFRGFSAIGDTEFRRYAYTAYYLLHFGWDRLGSINQRTPENLNRYLSCYRDFDRLLEGDVKYSIIKAVTGLRHSVREDNGEEAAENFKKLFEILQLKFTGERYIDDGTVSVSGVLDYAQFLLAKKAPPEDVETVAKFAKELVTCRYKDNTIRELSYHRRREIDDLLRWFPGKDN